jgi:hypothetical protein
MIESLQLSSSLSSWLSGGTIRFVVVGRPSLFRRRRRPESAHLTAFFQHDIFRCYNFASSSYGAFPPAGPTAISPCRTVEFLIVPHGNRRTFGQTAVMQQFPLQYGMQIVRNVFAKFPPMRTQPWPFSRSISYYCCCFCHYCYPKLVNLDHVVGSQTKLWTSNGLWMKPRLSLNLSVAGKVVGLPKSVKTIGQSLNRFTTFSSVWFSPCSFKIVIPPCRIIVPLQHRIEQTTKNE